MKKEYLLEKSKSGGIDEREENIFYHSFAIGGIAICVLAALFSLWKAIHGETFFEFGAIIFLYLSATEFYKYKCLKDKRQLISSIVTGFMTIFQIVMFLVKS